MDVLNDLRDRRSQLQILAQMMAQVGKECEGNKMETAARKAYAAAFVAMEWMDQIDQALAVLSGNVTREVRVTLVCPKCGREQGCQAVVNMLLPEGEWKDVECTSCGGHVGHIRADLPRVPKAYALSVYGVVDYGPDTRTNEERKPEALALAKGTVARAEELPPAREMRAALYGETLGDPVALSHGREIEDLRSRLEKAKSKLGKVAKPKPDDDF